MTQKFTLYDPETGKIVAQVTAPTVDSLDCYLSEGLAIAEGEHDPAHVFINPDTGKPNRHKSDVTRPIPPVDRRWSSLQHRRNYLLDHWRWTIMPDSPLTGPCQQDWLAYLRALQSITVGLTDPDKAVWPEPPALVYEQASKKGGK